MPFRGYRAAYASPVVHQGLRPTPCRGGLTAMSVAGRLLVATPPMDDPNFERSVILMLRHDDEGAFGLVVSHPSEELSAVEGSALAGWVDRTSPPAVLFQGGPVQLNTVIGLARFDDDTERSWTERAVTDVWTVDLRSDASNALECRTLRLFAGYSGWGSGQLEGELAAHHWFVVDFRPDDAFDSAPHTLWRRVLERDPAHREWVRSFPDDPSLN